MATETKRSKRTVTPEAHAEYVGRGAWVITTTVMPPSQNVLDREHWRRRKERVDVLTLLFRSVRFASTDAPAPLFHRALLVPLIFFPQRRRRDYANYMGGLKQFVDGLTHAGWLTDDDTEHLLHERPVMDVDRLHPRCVLRLEPWGGDR